MEYLKLFENHTDYEDYASGDTMVRPNVSYCEDVKDVHYNPIQYICKLTLNDGSVVKIEGSGYLTSAMFSAYSTTCVSIEVYDTCTKISSVPPNATSIIIPSSVTQLEGYSFARSKFTSITSQAMTAPSASGNVFYAMTTVGTLYVPIGSSGYDSWINYLLPNGWTLVEQ